MSKFLQCHSIDTKSSWQTSHAVETVAKFGDSGKFDPLVMGSHGHGTLANLVMRSVATEVLTHCEVPAPVLLVR